MDLSKLSDEDLQALSQNDLSKVSDEGLSFLSQTQQPVAQPHNIEAPTSFLGKQASGIQDIATTGMDLVAAIPKMLVGGGMAIGDAAVGAMFGDDPVNLDASRKKAQAQIESVVPGASAAVPKITGMPTGQTSEVLNKPFELLSKGIEGTGDYLTDITGNPNVGGAFKVGTDIAAPFIAIPGLHGATKLTKAGLEKTIKIPEIEQLRSDLGYETKGPDHLQFARDAITFEHNSIPRIQEEIDALQAERKDASDTAKEFLDQKIHDKMLAIDAAKDRIEKLDEYVIENSDGVATKRTQEEGQTSTPTKDSNPVFRTEQETSGVQRNVEEALSQHESKPALRSTKELVSEIKRLEEEITVAGRDGDYGKLKQLIANKQDIVKEFFAAKKAEKESQPVNTEPQTPFNPENNRRDVRSSFVEQMDRMDRKPWSDKALDAAIKSKADKLRTLRNNLDRDFDGSVQNLIDMIEKEAKALVEIRNKTKTARQVADEFGFGVDNINDMPRGTNERLSSEIEHQNLRDKLLEVSSLTQNPVIRHLSKFLLENKEIGKYTKMYYDAKQDGAMQARQTPEGVDVTARDASVLNSLNVVHEAVHVATSGMLHAFSEGVKFSPKVTKAIKDLKELHSKLDGELFEDLAAGIFQSMMRNKVEGVPWETIEKHAYALASEAVKNERELLAYGTTERDIMFALDQMNYDGISEKSKLYTSVAEMLGLDDRANKTALEALLNAAEPIIAESKGMSAKQLGGTGKDTIDNIRFWRTATGDLGYAGTNKFLKLAQNMVLGAEIRFLNSWGYAKYFNHPLITKLDTLTRNAQRDMQYILSDIMAGDTSPAGFKQAMKNKMFIMSQAKNHNSLELAIKNLSHKEMGEIIPGLIDALRDGVDLYGNEAKYLGPLTAAQKDFIRVFDRAGKRLLEHTNDMLKTRGLKEIPALPGYFLKTALGKFAVDVNANGQIISKEWYFSKAEAEHVAKKKMKADPSIIATISEKERPDSTAGVLAVLDEIEQSMNKAPSGIDTLDMLRAKFEQISLNANAVGNHRMHRTLLRGFAGDTGGSTSAMGKAFAEMIPKAVGEYANAVRVRQLAWDSSIELSTAQSRQKALMQPNAYKVGRSMVDHALNRSGNKEFTKALDGVGDVVTNYINDLYFKSTGNHLKGDVLQDSFRFLTTWGYRTILTPAPVTWLAQLMAIANTPRMIATAASNPIQGAMAGWNGLAKTMFKLYDKDHFEGLYYIMQKGDTFHKTIQHDLGKVDLGNTKAEGIANIRKWLLGEKFTEGSDTFTRVAAWNMAYEIQKAQGKTGPDAWVAAANMATDNMIPMGRENLPIAYKELGFIGTAMAPLRSYIHGMTTNLLTDTKNFFVDPGLRSTIVLSATMMSIMLQGGLLGAPFLADYEYLRKLGVRLGFFGEKDLPNWTAESMSHGDGLARGLVSGLTQIDMSSSTRYQSIFKPVGDLAIAPSIFDSSMPLSFASKAIGGTYTIGKNMLGDVPDFEARKAWDTVLPRGPARGAKEMLFNKFDKSTYGKRGEALVERGPAEVAGSFLGSSSNAEANSREINSSLDMVKKSYTAKKQRAVDLLLSDSPADKYAGRKIAQDLLKEGQITAKEFSAMTKNQAIKQHMPHELHQYLSPQGRFSTNTQARNLQEILKFKERRDE